jgi:hypothetical protein
MHKPITELVRQQHQFRLTGADFHTPKTRGLLFPLGLLCVAFFVLYLAR